MKLMDKELKQFIEEQMEKEFILFLLKKEFKEIREFAKFLGVSEKMIHLYIDQYYLPKVRPKYLRKKEGGYPRFKLIVDRLIKNFISYIQKKAEEENIDEIVLAKTIIDFIQK